MNALKLLLSAFFFFSLFAINMQVELNAQTIHRCQSDQKMQALFFGQPAYEQAIEDGFEEFNRQLSENNNKSALNIITIPVHIIILHPPGQAVGTGDNLSMDHIQSQIDVLNEDFRGINADASQTPAVFTVGDSEIEFCLATVDPNGASTDGVTRYATNQSMDNDEFNLKQATGWPREDYLNIWVDPDIGALGWAYLPNTGGLPNAVLDGCVVRTGSFGGPGYATLSPYNLGRTATHEVGHYLGLRHIWRNNGCGADDGINDTPLQDNENFGCPNHPSPSCNNGGDMFMNYMDYVNDNCMVMFSPDQGAYMRDILNTSRSSLLSAANVKCNLAAPIFASILTQTDVLCFGDATGSFTVDVTGGVPPYSFSINGGPSQDSPTFENLTAGIYTITVNDANGGLVDLETTITEPDLMIPFTDLQTDVNCFGGSDGTLTVGAFGGTPFPGDFYEYSFNGGNFSPNNFFDNLAAGTYTYSVQDANACIVTEQVTIGQAPELLVTEESLANVDCFGNNTGAIELTTTGGTPDYTYTLNQIDYQSESVFIDLVAGDYTAYIEDFNGCIQTYDFSISQPDELDLTLDTQTDLDCFGDSDGMVVLAVTGGTPNYQFSEDGMNFQDSDTFADLGAGAYQFTVEDENECQTTLDVTLDAPEEIIVALDDQTDLLCAEDSNGTASLSATGGTGALNYELNGISNTDGDFTDLSAGTYTASVTDANSCVATIDVTIEAPEDLELNTDALANVSCNGDADGSVNLLATGGTADYQYTLNGITNADGQFAGLSAGTYTAMVTDANSCTSMMDITIEEPAVLDLNSTAQTDISCNGEADGTVNLSAAGGSGSYTYTLDGVSNTDGQFSGLSAGSYTASVTDANGCTGTTSIDLEEPLSLGLTNANQNNVSCFGETDGSVNLTATGGTTTYTYSLDGMTNTDGQFNSLSAGTYTAMVTDANSCTETLTVNISEPDELVLNSIDQTDLACNGDADASITLGAAGGNGSYTYSLNGDSNSTGQFSGLDAGDYQAEVSDALGCTSSLSLSVEEPLVLSLNLDSSNDLSCFAAADGSIQMSASGGTGTLSFNLDGTTNTTGLFDNLDSGTYTIAVVDENSCQTTMDVVIDTPDELVLTVLSTQDVACQGGDTGMAELTAIGGTGNYSYTLAGQTNDTGIFNNLAPGDYLAEVSDENTCMQTIAVSIQEIADIDVNAQITDVSCFGDANASVQATASGGNGDFTFNLNGITNTTGSFDNLAAGTFDLVVTDENNCSTTEAITIDEPAELTLANATVDHPDCLGATDGSLQVVAQGGSGNYTYTLGQETNTTGVFANLGAGNYAVQIADGNNCNFTENIVLEDPTPISVENEIINNPDCFGDASGSIQVNAVGGTGSLTYTLGDETNTSGNFENLAAGDYTVVISDENNCSDSLPFSIEAPQAITLDIASFTNASCFGEADGSVQLSSTGGSGTISFSLNGETNTTGLFEGLNAGDYQVQATDANACTENIPISIEEPEILNGILVKLDNVSCNGEGNGSISVTAEGGTTDYQYELNGEVNDNGLFFNMDVGSYSVLITDANGCETTLDLTIGEPEPLEVDVQMTALNDCNGDTAAAFQANAVGGNGMYTYSLDGETNTTGSFTNLAAGDYELLVEDQSGCTTLSMVMVGEPTPIQVNTIETESIECAGDANAVLTVNASGGSGEYTYFLNGQNSVGGIFTDLAAGTYDLLVIDGDGCQQTDMVTIEEPSPITSGYNEVLPVLCKDGTDAVIQLFAEGGNENYTYSLGAETNNTGVFENVGAGTYEALISDDNGCTVSMQVLIEEPDALLLNVLNIDPVLCNGDATSTASFEGQGGTGPYNFLLNNVMSDDGTFNNLTAGNYMLVLLDANNCTTSYSFELTQPEAITSDFVVEDNLCFGDELGSVVATATGGTGGLIYQLGDQTNMDGSFENLSAGNYTAIITDENNCEFTEELTISEPEELVLDWELITSLQCFGDSNASGSLLANGGTGEYLYQINDGVVTDNPSIEGLGAGDYTANVSDENACVTTTNFTIDEPLEIELEVTDIINDTGSENGSFTVIPTNGNPPYMYSVNGAEFVSSNIFLNLPAGDYFVVVQDAAGCEVTITVTINLIDQVFEPGFGVEDLQLWPNPFSNQVWMEIDLASAQNLQFEVYTIHGQQLSRQTQQLGQGKHRFQLESMANLPAATYLLSVKNAEKNWYFKLIKQD